MTTALRPIVGTADAFLQQEKKFFVTYWGECLKAGLPDSQESLQQDGPSRY
jgi:hypothetical protein